MRDWWVSANEMTVWVMTNDRGLIVNCAPVVRKFLGQPLENLTRKWRRLTDVRVVQLKGSI